MHCCCRCCRRCHHHRHCCCRCHHRRPVGRIIVSVVSSSWRCHSVSCIVAAAALLCWPHCCIIPLAALSCCPVSCIVMSSPYCNSHIVASSCCLIVTSADGVQHSNLNYYAPSHCPLPPLMPSHCFCCRPLASHHLSPPLIELFTIPLPPTHPTSS